MTTQANDLIYLLLTEFLGPGYNQTNDDAFKSHLTLKKLKLNP